MLSLSASSSAALLAAFVVLLRQTRPAGTEVWVRLFEAACLSRMGGSPAYKCPEVRCAVCTQGAWEIARDQFVAGRTVAQIQASNHVDIEFTFGNIAMAAAVDPDGLDWARLATEARLTYGTAAALVTGKTCGFAMNLG